MYHFAIVALLGLALWKVVGALLGFAGQDLSSHVKAIITLALGVGAAVLLDYSVFAGWGVTFRETWMDTVFTGLVIGGMAYVAHSVMGLIEAYGRRNRDEAREIERRAHAA
jgi:hypothetical protein